MEKKHLLDLLAACETESFKKRKIDLGKEEKNEVKEQKKEKNIYVLNENNSSKKRKRDIEKTEIKETEKREKGKEEKAEDQRITWLKDYLITHKENHVYFNEFYDYLKKKYTPSVIHAAFSKPSFEGNSPVDNLFAQFRKSPERNIMERNIDKDCRHHIYRFLDAKSLCQLSYVSQFFKNEIKSGHHLENWKRRISWKPTLLELLKEELVNQIVEKNIIQEFPHLCAVLDKMKKTDVQAIQQEWELLLMSGEDKAIHYAISEFKIDANRKNSWGENPLHLTVFSGRVTAVKIILSSFKFNLTDLTYKKHSLLHLAAWNGNPDMIKYVRWLFHINKIDYFPQTMNEYNKNTFFFVDFSNQEDWAKLESMQALKQPIEEIEAMFAYEQSPILEISPQTLQRRRS